MVSQGTHLSTTDDELRPRAPSAAVDAASPPKLEDTSLYWSTWTGGNWNCKSVVSHLVTLIASARRPTRGTSVVLSSVHCSPTAVYIEINALKHG